jgi:carboxyl-terminal processing protease
MRKQLKITGAFLFSILLSVNIYGQSKEFEISKNIDIYASLFKELQLNYVDEIKPGELNEAAINALLESLDPYTVYISESDIEDY